MKNLTELINVQKDLGLLTDYKVFNEEDRRTKEWKDAYREACDKETLLIEKVNQNPEESKVRKSVLKAIQCIDRLKYLEKFSAISNSQEKKLLCKILEELYEDTRVISLVSRARIFRIR